MECDDPINPDWKRIAIFKATEDGFQLQRLAESPVFLTLTEWFADGITSIVEDRRTGKLKLNKVPPKGEEFIREVEDKLGARYRLIQ